MKKSLSYIAMFFISLFFLKCTEDSAGLIGPVDLSGQWTGTANDGGGVQLIEMTLTQTYDSLEGTPDAVSGSIDAGEDILSLTGTVQNADFTGVVTGNCTNDFEITIKREGLELVGPADERTTETCDGKTVNLLFFKHRPADFNVSGTWLGNFNGNESGHIKLELNHGEGDYVSGYIYPQYDTADPDTLYATGYLYGDDLIMTIPEDQENCGPTVVIMRVNGTSMAGKARGGQSEGEGAGEDCAFTVNISVSKSAVTKK